MDTNSSSPRFNLNAEFVNLRQPNISTTNHQDGPMNPMSRSANPQQRSIMLSPNAPEFVPRNNHSDNVIKKMSNSIKQPSVQNRLNLAAQNNTFPQQQQQNSQNYHNHFQHQQQQQQHQHNTNQHHQPPNYYYNNSGGNNSYNQSVQNIPNSNNAPIHQNRNVSRHHQEDPVPSQDTFDPSQDEAYAISYVESIVNSLNENPGSFDSIAIQAQILFKGFTDNYYVLSNAMEIIFNKSIEEQNFRYMGAKLYNLLDSIDHRKDSMFRNLLSFKLTYHKEEIINFIKNKGQHKVRGTTLFLAELYMQLRDEGDTVKEIAQSIVFSIEQLLTNTSPENLKCICLTLKLAGYDLDNDCPNNMEYILSVLRTINHMDVSTSRLLESVLKLKDNCWGRTEEVKEYSSNNAPYVNNCDEPVFYGPDGQVLTEEESMFLASISNSDNVEDNDSEYEYNPEMDAETESAFKDFLRSNRKM